MSSTSKSMYEKPPRNVHRRRETKYLMSLFQCIRTSLELARDTFELEQRICNRKYQLLPKGPTYHMLQLLRGSVENKNISPCTIHKFSDTYIRTTSISFLGNVLMRQPDGRYYSLTYVQQSCLLLLVEEEYSRNKLKK